MIAMRGLQGFAGGVLIPMAFTLILTQLPKPQQPIGLAMFALSVHLRACDRPDHRRLPDRELRLADHLFRQRGADHRHGERALFHARAAADTAQAPEGRRLGRHRDHGIGLSSLQAVLEEGNKNDWFASPFIVKLAIVSLVKPHRRLFWIELTVEKPLIRLRLLKGRNFGFGTMALTLLGFALFRLGLYPAGPISARCSITTPSRSARVLAWTGLPQLILIPLVPQLMKRFDHPLRRFRRPHAVRRELLHEHHDVARLCRRPAVPSNVVRAIGQALVLTPLTSVSTSRHRATGCAGGVGHQQHVPQSRRRHRHGRACDLHHQARAVPLQHHRPVGFSGPRGSRRPHRPDDRLLSGARHHRRRCRQAAGESSRSACGETSGTLCWASAMPLPCSALCWRSLR